MIVEGTYAFAAPPERVWRVLLDPAVMEKSMPGARDLRRVQDGRYEGVIELGAGPLTADFALVVQLVDVREPNHYGLDIDSTGRIGYSRGRANVDLAPAGAGTLMTYRADLDIGGTMAGLGQGLLDSIGRMMTRQGLDALSAEVERRLKDEEAG